MNSKLHFLLVLIALVGCGVKKPPKPKGKKTPTYFQYLNQNEQIN